MNYWIANMFNVKLEHIVLPFDSESQYVNSKIQYAAQLTMGNTAATAFSEFTKID
jgi:hypothetical protein